MNTNGNTYTVIYSAVLVILVAAILAFVAMILQPETDVMKMYAEKVKEAFFVDGNGKKVGEMNIGKENLNDIQVSTTSDLKKQNDLMKKLEEGSTDLLGELQLPVYVFDINGKTVTVIPCYGAGLWGPIWGYVALAEDGKTIGGAVFDHKGETPGLGAKIADEPFCNEFKGKSFNTGNDMFAVLKGDNSANPHAVDAISGATITSQALGRSINLWAKYYEPYLKTMAAVK